MLCALTTKAGSEMPKKNSSSCFFSVSKRYCTPRLQQMLLTRENLCCSGSRATTSFVTSRMTFRQPDATLPVPINTTLRYADEPSMLLSRRFANAALLVTKVGADQLMAVNLAVRVARHGVELVKHGRQHVFWELLRELPPNHPGGEPAPGCKKQGEVLVLAVVQDAGAVDELHARPRVFVLA